MLIIIIIPATKPKSIAYVVSENKLARTSQPKRAATTSEAPERIAQRKALRRLPVA
jgi:hypothetical protein